MLLALFGAITLLCFLTFRSWEAVLCIILPLALVSILCNALMATLGIGLKVSTLPVIALGVGVGVDYGIYLYERIEAPHGGEARACARRSSRRCAARHGGGVHRGDDEHRRGHLGLLGAQVPGRHGPPARLHVRREHARRDLPAAGAGGDAASTGSARRGADKGGPSRPAQWMRSTRPVQTTGARRPLRIRAWRRRGAILPPQHVGPAAGAVQRAGEHEQQVRQPVEVAARRGR